MQNKLNGCTSHPIAKGSEEKSKCIKVSKVKSAQGAWHILENGSRVYILFKNNQPILWVQSEKKNE